MIFPGIFDGLVMGFFTDREMGVDVSGMTSKEVYFPIQEHTDLAMVLGDDFDPQVADAVVTQRTDVMLGVKVADCVPILLFDRSKKALGAVHAGWRGTAAGILKKTIALMARTFSSSPEDVLVAMGPAIRWCCYKVDRDVFDAVRQQSGEGRYHRRSGNKVCLDLQGANLVQALSMGVPEAGISIVEECTFCYPDRYYSYRYDRNTKGRQGGFIGMP